MTHQDDVVQEEERSVAFATEASLGMPGSIKQVADFLLSEGTGIEQMTMAEIAARAYTSKPTLVRFAKQAGYAGWKDYRRDFLLAMKRLEVDRARQASVDINFPISAGDSGSQIIMSLGRIHELAIEQVRSIDHETLDQAASAILAAHDLVFFGAMQNLQRGKIFASDLGSIGILCRTPHSDETASVAKCLGAGDCLVVASYSGGLTHIPMALIPELKQRGVIIVAITNSQRGGLGEIADYRLGFAPLEHHHVKIGAFYSGACTSLILEALYIACYAQHFDKSRSNREDVVTGLRGYIPDDFDTA
ncbi:MAG: MurR/RpiR family transcriptional regulator [Coriobacteriales bacterium]|nr:MurR/RpiR family transcriptional regulator [Coriobacteriales bacterium]